MIPSNLSNSELACLLRNGDRPAFNVIYHQFAEELFRYAAKKVETRAACEKIILNLFVELWEEKEFTPDDLKAYLYDKLRKQLVRYAFDNPTSQLYAHLKELMNQWGSEND